MAEIIQRTDFNILRYANCWEDPQLLLDGLDIQPGDHVLSIGSAGDNSFSLLMANPHSIVAVDISKTQLALLALKKAAIQRLDYDELLRFLGFRPSDDRRDQLHALKGHLPDEVFDFWCSQPKQIAAGIVHQGKFERYFQLFSQRVLPWIHRKKIVQQLLSPKSEQEQALFYHCTWNTWRWRLLFKIFFSRSVMGRLGRDPEFLREVTVPVGESIFRQAEKQLCSISVQTNFMLRYNLTGSFGDLLPHYLQPENHALIKSRIHKIICVEGLAEDAVREYGMFHRMNLSNIFEYMDMQTFRATARELMAGLHPEGRVAYWNLMVPRQLSDVQDTGLRPLTTLAATLRTKDRGFYYRDFILDQKNG